MAPLRMRTSRILASAWVTCLFAGLVAGGICLWGRPESRLGAAITWAVLGAGIQMLSGEGVSRASVIFSSLLSLPIVLAGLGAYEVHQRWGVSMEHAFLGVLGVAVLTLVIFFRILIAAGSADYPYDE